MDNHPPPRPPSSGQATSPVQNRKRSGSGGGILSKFPFMRTSESRPGSRDSRHDGIAEDISPRDEPLSPLPQLPTSQQPEAPPLPPLPKPRKRKGSLRKVALLGRGAQRDRRGELKPPPIETINSHLGAPPAAEVDGSLTGEDPVTSADPASAAVLGLGITDITPRPSMDGYARRADLSADPAAATSSRDSSSSILDAEPHVTSPTISYTSTTDEEDVLSLKTRIPASLRPGLTAALSSGSESYLKPGRAPLSSSLVSIQRRRSIKHAKSPLSLQGLTASPLPAQVIEPHDYGETEWWGWIILVVTWVVFVVGMGSCLGVWSWAWDVGTTPYAPPEFEDDPTLPIVGYYPALMILTCIMAWVWVITAWVGMKYFRHAKISSD
ncbi:hypothetical protein BX600DRAFT_512099 [Xylariales sp. PMI_506]|nr:hypothetical protein BX600DRAFT_512099 [Xylariales sp. PMI_506]